MFLQPERVEAPCIREELQDFYVANLSQKDMWVGDLLENEAKKVFIE